MTVTVCFVFIYTCSLRPRKNGLSDGSTVHALNRQTRKTQGQKGLTEHVLCLLHLQDWLLGRNRITLKAWKLNRKWCFLLCTVTTGIHFNNWQLRNGEWFVLNAAVSDLPLCIIWGDTFIWFLSELWRSGQGAVRIKTGNRSRRLAWPGWSRTKMCDR